MEKLHNDLYRQSKYHSLLKFLLNLLRSISMCTTLNFSFLPYLHLLIWVFQEVFFVFYLMSRAFFSFLYSLSPKQNRLYFVLCHNSLFSLNMLHLTRILIQIILFLKSAFLLFENRMQDFQSNNL